MAVSDESFVAFVRDQLQALRGVAFRRMFGGYGIYADARFFGIVYQGRLYFKTDATSRASYRDRGMHPLHVSARQTLNNYHEVPLDVLEDSETLIAWAQEALESKTTPRRRLARKRTKTSSRRQK